MGNVAKNSSLYLVSTIALRATSFLLLPFYSYLITPDVYGRVFVANALMSFLAMLMPMALNSAVHRYYFECKSHGEERLLYSTVVWAATAFVALFAAAMLIPIQFWAGVFEIPSLYILLATTSAALQVYYTIITSFLYAKQQAKAISVVTIFVGTIQIIVQLVLVITMTDKALALLITFLINSVVSFCVFLYFSRAYLAFVFDVGKVKEYFVYGVSQLPSDVSSKIVSLMDRFILNRFVNSTAVGLYGIAFNLASIPCFVFTSINQALVPSVFIDFKENTEDAYRAAVSKIELTFALLTVLFSLLIVYSNHIILVLSDRYKESGTIMCFILVAQLLDTYRVLFMYPMQYNVKYVKVKSAIWVFAAVLSISLNFMLIPKMSIYGAATSFIISNFVTLIMILHYSHKAIDLPYNKSRLTLIVLTSAVFSLSVLCGDSLWALLVKVILTVTYTHIIYVYSIKKYTNLDIIDLKTQILSYVKLLSHK